MILGLLVLLSALSISAVAIYYSIAGLVAIFAAAAVPIMIMGTALEIGKLVTAVWLHKYWERSVWWLKTYLSVAVVVLMFITSMGIFGYLSKAHIEQTSASQESVEKIEQIKTEILRYTNIANRAEEKIIKLENAGSNKNENIQVQIDREQERIDTAYDRIGPLVKEQQNIIQSETERKDKKIEPYLVQVSNIDADLATLTNLLNRRDRESIKRMQSIVGTRVDGTYGSRTAKQVENYRDGLLAKRESILNTITKIEDKESPIITAANEEIKRLRGIAEQEISDSNKVINRLREEIGNVSPTTDNSVLIEEQNIKINNATNTIETLTEEKYALEAEYRKLEAEVGPIKYIAEFVYGEEADRDLLEEAVRWVIILIIFVFDPLAVLLLIASQYTFQYTRGLPLAPKEPDPQPEPEVELKFEDVDQETIDNEFKDEDANLAFLNDEKKLNTIEEQPTPKKETKKKDKPDMSKDEIGLYKNVGVTKIKGKLGFPKAQHNKEQIKKALKSQGVDIKFLDEE